MQLVCSQQKTYYETNKKPIQLLFALTPELAFETNAE